MERFEASNAVTGVIRHPKNKREHFGISEKPGIYCKKRLFACCELFADINLQISIQGCLVVGPTERQPWYAIVLHLNDHAHLHYRPIMEAPYVVISRKRTELAHC